MLPYIEMAIGVGVELCPSSVRAVIMEGTRFGASRATKRRPRPDAGEPPAHSGASRTRLLAAHEVACDPADLDALTRALTELRRALRIRAPIVLGLPSTSAILTTVTPLIASQKKSFLAVQFELQQHLPFALPEAVWHYQWLSGAVVVAAMKGSVLEERLACCRRAGLSIKAVAINPVATLNAWHADHSSIPRPALDEREAAEGGGEAAALVNILDGQTAEWIVWTPDSLQVAPVFSPSQEAFGEDLAAAWEALRSQGRDVPTRAWVVGSPTGGAWERLHEALTRRCGLRVERAACSRLIGNGAVRLEREPGAMITAVGLALQGLGRVRLSLNLLASAHRERQSRYIRRAALITARICVAATVALGLGGMVELRHRRARILEVLRRQEQLYQSLRPDVRSLLQRQHGMQQRIQRLERLVEDAPAAAQLLAQVAEALPDDVWLSKLECSKTSLPVGMMGSPVEMLEGVLEGRARSFQTLTRFLETLKSSAGPSMTIKPLSTNVAQDEASGKEVVVFAVQVQRLLARSTTPTVEP
ncbi:MAG: PilN domain-containing protein [Candidatus Omnitrophica bacterium]|nr:PilN domain-containing protein [Candidatus Omnitrophota bacterium]